MTVERFTPVELDDTTDPRVAMFRLRDRQLFPGLQGRAQDAPDGLFAAEGDLVVRRALDAGYVPHATLADSTVADALLSRAGETGAPVYLAAPRLRAELTGLGVPAAIITLFHRRPDSAAGEVLAKARRVVLAEAVDNPTNLGTIIRSAVGLGWDTIAVDETSVDPFSRRSVRTSMGTVFSAMTTRLDVNPIRILHDFGFVTVALTPRAEAVDIRDLHHLAGAERLAIVLGAERSGLSDDTMQSATHTARIAMHAGTDSLNVAAAAAVTCFALSGSATAR